LALTTRAKSLLLLLLLLLQLLQVRDQANDLYIDASIIRLYVGHAGDIQDHPTVPARHPSRA